MGLRKRRTITWSAAAILAMTPSDDIGDGFGLR
jgi:hypothetical protein